MKLKLGLMSLIAVGMLVGCGGEGSSKSSKSEKIDFSKYVFPEKSMKKKVIAEQKFKDSNGKAWGGSIENIVVKGNKVEYLEKDSSFVHSSFDIETNTIYAYYPSLSYYYQIYGDEIKRNIEVGDTIWTKGQTVCKLESQVDSLRHKYINFQGSIGDTISRTELSSEEKELYSNDILKVKCTNGNSKKDITYYYFKKGIGRIATIQDNCYDENGVMRFDTTECSTSDYYYNFYVNDSYNKAMKELDNRVVPLELNTTLRTTDEVINLKGKELYEKCVGCHGIDGQSKALGKSDVIGGEKKSVLIRKLNAYKEGSLNKHGMGALMKEVVSAYSRKDIDDIAEYISSL